MYLFELYNDPSVMGVNAASDWFGEYMQKVFPLLEKEPEVGMTAPLWAKGVTL